MLFLIYLYHMKLVVSHMFVPNIPALKIGCHGVTNHGPTCGRLSQHPLHSCRLIIHFLLSCKYHNVPTATSLLWVDPLIKSVFLFKWTCTLDVQTNFIMSFSKNGKENRWLSNDSNCVGGLNMMFFLPSYVLLSILLSSTLRSSSNLFIFVLCYLASNYSGDNRSYFFQNIN
jgi:hypothetical protein